MGRSAVSTMATGNGGSRAVAGRVRSTPACTGGRTASASSRPSGPSARSSAVDDPWTSTATTGGIRPAPVQASEERSAVRATVSTAGPGEAPASRRSSPAMIGPKKETSARPRPSSSATMAASTPDAVGAPPPVAARSSRHPEAATAASSLAARSGSPMSATACGPSWATSRAAESRRACCSAENRTSISRPRAPRPATPTTRRGASAAVPSPTAGAGHRRPRRRSGVACRWPARRRPAPAAHPPPPVGPGRA